MIMYHEFRKNYFTPCFGNSFKEVRFLLTSKMVSMTPRLLADEFELRESVIITLRNSNTHFLAG